MLGPILFIIFINDLFFHVKRAKLNAYVDDHQVCYSHVNPAALEAFALMTLGWPISGTMKMGCLVKRASTKI